jgi:hypothetical protein
VREFHAVTPSPNLFRFVSVSYPISPGARTGFEDVHSAAVPRRIWMVA